MNLDELKDFVESLQIDAKTPEDRVLASKARAALRADFKQRLSSLPIGKRMAFWEGLDKDYSKWLKHFLFAEDYRWRKYLLCFLLPVSICLGGIAMLVAWAITGSFDDAWPWMMAAMVVFSLDGLIWFYCVRPKCGICGNFHWFGVCEDEYPDKAARDKERRISARIISAWMASITIGIPWVTLRPEDANMLFWACGALILVIVVVAFFVKRKRRATNVHHGCCPRCGGPLDGSGFCPDCTMIVDRLVSWRNLDEDNTRVMAAFVLEILAPANRAGRFLGRLPSKFEMGRYSEDHLPAPGIPFCSLGLLVQSEASSYSRRYLRFTYLPDEGFNVELLADNDCKVAGNTLKKGDSAVAKVGDTIEISPDWVFKVVPRK